MHFNQLNIKKSLLQGVEKAKYETMTEVQENIIPAFLEGKDILAKAPTGTGKTAAFAIPSLEKVNTEVKTPQVLILVPTRELAVQTGEEYKKLSSFIPNLKVVTIYGGQKIDVQLKALKYNPQIIASTPGRLIDHVKRKSIDLSHITTIILDEVDEMVNMGFINDIKTIFSLFTNPHQTILISATFSDSVNKISERYQKDPVVFEAKNTLVSEPKITPFYVKINEANKLTFLTKMLKDNPWKLVVVFTNTKWKARDISESLKKEGISSYPLHSDMSQNARDKVMKEFREGKFRVLVGTDIAARGIDVKGVECVFNFDMPKEAEHYVHRIGRTGRNQTEGTAYTLLNYDVDFSIKKIEKITNKKISEHSAIEFDFIEERNPNQRGGRGGNRNGGNRNGGNRGFNHSDSNSHHGSRENHGNHSFSRGNSRFLHDRNNNQEGKPSEHQLHERNSEANTPEGGESPKRFDSKPRNFGDRKSFGNKPRSFGGEKKSFGDRKSFGNKPRSFGGEKKSFGDRKPFGEKKSYGNDRQYAFQRRENSGGRSAFGTKKRNFSGTKKSGNN